MCGIPIGCAEDLGTVLAPVDLERTAICFDGAVLPGLAFLLVEAKRRRTALSRLRGELGFDPIHDVEHIDEPALEETRWRVAGELLSYCAEHAPQLRPLSLDGRSWHEAGASAAEEIACMLAGAIETSRALERRGHSFDQIAKGLGFRVPITTDLLLQVAKLRALRWLWAKVASAFLPEGTAIPSVPVAAYSSERTRARRHDLRTNLVRGAVEAVAATLGGCSAFCLEPHDPHPDYQDDEARGLARFSHHLLREEGFLDRVVDPTAGSFAIETLTHEVASRAWSMLQEIEAKGGMLPAMRSGFVLERLLRTGSERLARVRRREEVLIGVSHYVDPDLEGERRRGVDRAALVRQMEDRLAAQRGAQAPRAQALTELTSALRGRGPAVVEATVRAAEAGCAGFEIADALDAMELDAEEAAPHDLPTSPEPEDMVPELLVTDACDFEDLRDMLTEGGSPPRALVLAVGSGVAKRQRADFAADLLRAGGFEVARPDPIQAVAGLASAVARHDPELAVLCSNDDAYAELCAELRGTPPDSTRCIVAVVGRPQASLRDAVDAFLFEGGDLLARLDYLSKLVEHRRMANGTPPASDELRQSLEGTLEAMKSWIEREEQRADR
jgi:methylmalonyl-CoA mutase